MERKTLQVIKPVHTIIQDVKAARSLKSDSEAIAYLYAVYEGLLKQDRITLKQHEEALERKNEILNQATL